MRCSQVKSVQNVGGEIRNGAKLIAYNYMRLCGYRPKGEGRKIRIQSKIWTFSS